jgi:hypothetical protein
MLKLGDESGERFRDEFESCFECATPGSTFLETQFKPLADPIKLYFSLLMKNFSVFTVKLGHFTIYEFFIYVTNTQS